MQFLNNTPAKWPMTAVVVNGGSQEVNGTYHHYGQEQNGGPVYQKTHLKGHILFLRLGETRDFWYISVEMDLQITKEWVYHFKHHCYYSMRVGENKFEDVPWTNEGYKGFLPPPKVTFV